MNANDYLNAIMTLIFDLCVASFSFFISVVNIEKFQYLNLIETFRRYLSIDLNGLAVFKFKLELEPGKYG
jgi:hypothetical protein